MEITPDEFKLLTGSAFADRLPLEMEGEATASFALLLKIAKLRLLTLLGGKTESEVVAVAEEAGSEVLLQLLLARLIEVLLAEQTALDDHGLASKVVEDFRINFDTKASPAMEQFVKDHADLLAFFRGATTVRFPACETECGRYLL